MRRLSRSISLFLSLILALSPCMVSIAQAQSTTDFIPPKVLHEPETEAITGGQTYVLTATVTDENSVGRVTLFYRAIGETAYESTELLYSGTQDIFIVELDASELTSPGLEYYLQAEDVAGNTLLRGFSFDPLVLHVELANGVTQTADSNNVAKDLISEPSSKKLLWIGLGALVLGGLALSGGGGSGSGGGSDTVTVSAPIPQ